METYPGELELSRRTIRLCSYTEPEESGYYANLRKVLGQATIEDYAYGLRFFYDCRRTVAGLAKYYGYSISQAVGVFSALSPNNDLRGNYRGLASILLWNREGISRDSINAGTYRHCLERAYRVLDGERFLSFTEGLKTRSFYINILWPNNPTEVTIDGHMINAAMGGRVPLRYAVRFRNHYEHIAEATRALARLNNLLPSQIQGIIWHTWKRLHDIHTPPQKCIWGGIIPPEVIRPFRPVRLSPLDRRIVERYYYAKK